MLGKQHPCKAHLVLRDFTEAVFIFCCIVVHFLLRGSGRFASLSCDTHRDTGRLAAPLCWRSHLAASPSSVRLGSSILANANFSSNIPLLLHAPLSAAIWFPFPAGAARCSFSFPLASVAIVAPLLPFSVFPSLASRSSRRGAVLSLSQLRHTLATLVTCPASLPLQHQGRRRRADFSNNCAVKLRSVVRWTAI